MNSRKEIATWVGIAIYLALVIGFAWNPTPFAQLLAAIGVMGAVGHAVLNLGWRHAAVFVAICLTVSFTMENIGATTGLPFGQYHFTVGATLPHVGVIPVIVGLLWFGMGYFSPGASRAACWAAPPHPSRCRRWRRWS